MCRHAAAIGAPISLASIMLDAPHSLHEQSYKAKELLTGVVCADGFAVGWYDEAVQREPVRYARGEPIWSDADFQPLSRIVHSNCMVGAVRNATVAGSNHANNAQPFVSGRYLFSHNGYLENWSTAWKDEVKTWISQERLADLRGDTDSEYLFMALRTVLDESDPEPSAMATACVELLRRVDEFAKQVEAAAYCNFIVADGSMIVATKHASSGPANSLYTAHEPDFAPHSTFIASEPLDDDECWRQVPDNMVVVAQGGAPLVTMRI